MTKSTTVSVAQITRAMNALRAHGIEVTGVRLRPDGSIDLLSTKNGEEEKSDEPSWVDLAGAKPRRRLNSPDVSR